MKFLVLLILIGFAGIIYTQQAFAEDSFDSMYDFSEKDFETGRFSYPYGEKFYQYKYEPFGALAEESFSRCHFTSSFVLSNDSPSESGNVIYKFPRDMVWPGGHENSTFYIARSSSFNFPEDSHFEKLTPTKTNDGMVLEFKIVTGLNTFVANSTALWDSQRSQIMNCPDPFDFEKHEYEYYDFAYPLKVQQNRAKMWGLPEDDFLCKLQLVPVLKNDGSPACVKTETKEKLVQRGWAKNEHYPFGIMGPIMTQQSCNDYVISQWQPTFEGKERVQQFLEICIQRGFVTPDLIERGKIADNFTHGPIQTAKRSAGGDIEKTIENLEEMYEEKTNENLDGHEEDIGKAIVHVDLDKEEYHAGDVVIISGYVERMMPDTELNITVRNPLMDVVLVSQVTISEDRTFTESLPIGGPLWEQNGIYSVSIQYGKAIDHTDFLYLSDLESDDLL